MNHRLNAPYPRSLFGGRHGHRRPAFGKRLAGEGPMRGANTKGASGPPSPGDRGDLPRSRVEDIVKLLV